MVDLKFLKPFKASNDTRFDLTRTGNATEVTWTMTGRRGAVVGPMGTVFVDKAIGKDFEKGLATLIREAQRGWPCHCLALSLSATQRQGTPWASHSRLSL